MNVRILLLKAGSVLHCGCGAVTGQCQPRRSGSSPAAYLRGKPPPPDGPRPRGSLPPAVVDWPPDNRFIYQERWPRVLCLCETSDAVVPFIKMVHNTCSAKENQRKCEPQYEQWSNIASSLSFNGILFMTRVSVIELLGCSLRRTGDQYHNIP